MSNGSVRGTGRARAGATDTTMLIWKVIAASPGITHDQIWERAEHSIPVGYALRRYTRARKCEVADESATSRARHYVLTDMLTNMRKCGNVARDEGGAYTPVRPPKYRGNPDAIDETGTKAAEHMAVASALRVAEKALAKPYSKGAGAIRSQELYDAITVMVKALRAKGPAAS